MKKLIIFVILISLSLLYSPAYAVNIVRFGPEYIPQPSAGRPLALANIYVGEQDTDPTDEDNQKQLYIMEEDGTFTAVSQPISTGAGGVPLYNGDPVTLYVSGSYSITVLSSGGSQIYYNPNVIPQYEPGITTVPLLSDYLDLADAKTTIGNTPTELWVDESSVMDEDVTGIPVTLKFKFLPGCTITTTGYTLGFSGGPKNHIIASGQQQIFDGTGTVTFAQQDGIVLNWFPGDDLSEKWDNARAGLTKGKFKTIIINYPNISETAAIDYSTQGYIWRLDDVLHFDDPENNLTWIQNAPFVVTTNVTDIFEFSASNKIENVQFPLGIRGYVNTNITATNGFHVYGGARIVVGGIFSIHGCTYPILLEGSNFNVEEVMFDKIYAGSWVGGGAAVLIDGNTNGIWNVSIREIKAEGASAANSSVLYLKGGISTLRVGLVHNKSTSNVDQVVLMESTSDGRPYNMIHIDQIWSNVGASTKGIVTQNNGGSQKIEHVIIGQIDNVITALAADLDYIRSSRINKVMYSSDITIGSDAQDLEIWGVEYGTLTDGGTRTLVNGLGQNVGDPNSTGDWNGNGHEGIRVVDTNTNVFYNYTSSAWMRDKVGTTKGSATLADDTATSFTPPDDSGIVIVVSEGTNSHNRTSVVAFKCDAGSSGTTLIGGGSDVEVTTGILAGTTGSDDKITISAHTDGKIYIENRRGGETVFNYTVID